MGLIVHDTSSPGEVVDFGTVEFHVHQQVWIAEGEGRIVRIIKEDGPEPHHRVHVERDGTFFSLPINQVRKL